jgi:hypothetical protein
MPSTVIAHIEYDREKALLTIRFTSGVVYQYLDVPEEVYVAFKQYREKGVYLNKEIKGKYAYRKMG